MLPVVLKASSESWDSANRSKHGVDDRMGGNGLHAVSAHDASSVLLAWLAIRARISVTSWAARCPDSTAPSM
jgi:hypothetical protein